MASLGTPPSSPTPNESHWSSWRPSSPRTHPGNASPTSCTPRPPLTTTPRRYGRSRWRSARCASGSPSLSGCLRPPGRGLREGGLVRRNHRLRQSGAVRRPLRGARWCPARNGLRGDLPSPALPGSGPGGRRSASQLSGFSAFRRDSRRVPPGSSSGPAPSLASQTCSCCTASSRLPRAGSPGWAGRTSVVCPAPALARRAPSRLCRAGRR